MSHYHSEGHKHYHQHLQLQLEPHHFGKEVSHNDSEMVVMVGLVELGGDGLPETTG